MANEKSNEIVDWSLRTETLQLHSIEELLKQQSYMQAAWLLERHLIAGDQVSIKHLLQLPICYGQNSPYIMQAIAHSLLQAGKLDEAEQTALLAVKGFATLYMPQPLLGSLALLGRIKLRMGEFDMAEVIVEQLRQEFEEMQGQNQDDVGEVAHCLALGSLLLIQFADAASHENIQLEDKEIEVKEKRVIEKRVIEKRIQAIKLFQNAIRAYIHQSQWQNACLAMVELAWHAGKYLEVQDWDWLHLHCMTASSMKDELRQYEKILKMIESYYKQHWWNMYLLADEWINREQKNDNLISRSYWIRSMKVLLVFSCITGMQSSAIEQLTAFKLVKQERVEMKLTAVRRRTESMTTIQRLRTRSNAKNASLRLWAIADKYEQEMKACMTEYALDIPLQYELITSLLERNKRIGKETRELVQRRQIMLELLRVSSVKPQSVSLTSHVQDKAHSWQIHLFGRMRFSKGQEERMQLEWKRKKAKELFLFLALQPRYMAVREIVIEALQLGEQLEKGVQQLYVIIHQLKRTLECELGMAQAVIVKDGIIKLREELIDYVDVERYLNLIRVADQLWQFDRDLSYEMYEQAYLLYDELLPELPYIEWLDRLREHVLQKQIILLQKCIIHAEARDDWQHAEIYLRSWITLQPYQEEAHAQLISSLIQQGRLNEAKSAYAAWKECCQTELETTPSFVPSFITTMPQNIRKGEWRY